MNAVIADEPGGPPALITYETRLDRDRRWAMDEGDRYFHENSSVFQTMRAVVRRLDGIGVPYAVVGGLAMFHHGVRRFTDDVDILVTTDGCQKLHAALEGLGYVPPFAGSRHLRDTQTGVKIEFLIAGDYPGDGKPKPVAFPDPSAVADDADGVRYIRLRDVVELKLASGMTGRGRRKDMLDVLELIKVHDLPRDYTNRLDPTVRPAFEELWEEARPLDPEVAERYGFPDPRNPPGPATQP